MYQRLSQTTDDIKAFDLGLPLDQEEYETLRGDLEHALERRGRICFLLRITAGGAKELNEFWSDLIALVPHWQDVYALAVVAPPPAEGAWAEKASQGIKKQLRFFEEGDIASARGWLLQRQADLEEERRGGSELPVMFERILCAVDLKPGSEYIMRKTQAMARRVSAQWHIVHVVDAEPPVALGENWLEELPPEGHEPVLASARETLDKLVKSAGIPSARVEVLRGHPARKLVRYAEDWRADLLIVGSYGRSGMRWLLGSTATAVLGRASCDVLAVRMPR